jgi:type IV pilus assembly protein PilC
MTLYTYKGFENERVVRGVLEAKTSQDLIEKLNLKKIHLIWYYPKKWKKLKKLSFQESLIFCTHLEYLLKTGTSLTKSLQSMSTHTSQHIQRLARLLNEKIDGGFSLSKALESEEKEFDPIFISLVKTGESHGDLSQTFSQIKTYLIWKNKLQKTLIQTLRYPFILFFLLLGVLTTLTVFLVPPLRSFLTAVGIEQSLSTRLLLRFTDMWIEHGATIFLSLFFFFSLLFLSTRLKRMKLFWGRLLIQAPFIGGFLVKSWLIKISMNLFLLLKAGIFLPQALKITENQTDNLYLRSILEKISLQIHRGRTLSEAFFEFKAIPSFVHHFIKAGEESNNLSESFLIIRDYYTESLQHQIDFLKDLLPTICLLLVGGVLVWIILGIFYPLYGASIGI